MTLVALRPCLVALAALVACGGDAPPPQQPQTLPGSSLVVKPGDLHMVDGDKMIMPDDQTRIAMTKTGFRRLQGTVKMCLDATGHVDRVVLLKSSGVESYDLKIVRRVKEFMYEPYVQNGSPVAVCTALTFIYTQH